MSDAEMYALARNRGPVLVMLPDTSTVLASLVAWKPRKGRTRARVQFASGSERCVHLSRVQGPLSIIATSRGEFYMMVDGTTVPTGRMPNMEKLQSE